MKPLFPRLVKGALAGASLFMLLACTTDPSSTTPVTPPVVDSLTPAQQLVVEAEDHFRQGQNAQALTAYEQALALDSSLSMAYYGHAKATVAFYKLDRIAVLEDFEALASGFALNTFLRHSDSVLTIRLQVASRVRKMLGKLTDRDSLTRWYNYLHDTGLTAAVTGDTLFASRRAFMTDYLIKADLNTPGYRKASDFPLSDLKMPAANLASDYAMFELLYTFTRLYDYDLNDTVDARDAIVKQLNFGNTGGFIIDSLSTIGGDLEGDTSTQSNLNDLITSMQSGLINSALLAQLIGKVNPDSSLPSGPEENIDSVIASLGDAILFYQFGDKLDNDGDGCVDEEILDEKDNDYDGFIDEDARVIPANKPDGVDNDHDGRQDPVNPPVGFAAGTDTLGREAPVGDVISPLSGHVLGFVYAYLDSTFTLGSLEKNLQPWQTTWVKIKKGAPPESMAIRLAIQADSLLTKRLPSGRLPDTYASKLQVARTQVGGCWRNVKTVSE